jgi:ribonuclease T1
MDFQSNQPATSSTPLWQQHWVKIVFGMGLLLLLAWLNSTNNGQVNPNGGVAGDRSTTSIWLPTSKSSAERQKDSADHQDSANSTPGNRAEGHSSSANQSSAIDSDNPTGSNHGSDNSLIVHNVRVTNEDGEIVYRGDVDLWPTLERIEQGVRLRFSHDGIVFENREHRLPRKPDGYYHEYVQPTPNEHGPGGQRLVLGEAGEVYYSPDHYQTFQRIR